MNARESDLARRVQSKLLKNEEAGLLLRFADSGTPREVKVQFNQIMCEME